MKNIFFISTLFFSFIISCNIDQENKTLQLGKKIVDIDGNFYETVIIGNQEWMKENLNVIKFSNGDTIFHAKTKDQWSFAYENEIPAYCNYDNNPIFSKKYGKLYNWYAVNDKRGLAPKGWSIPNYYKIKQLMDNVSLICGDEKKKYGLGSNYRFSYTYKDLGDRLKSVYGWKSIDYSTENPNGKDIVYFNALPGGFRDYYGTFLKINETGVWWVNTTTQHTFGPTAYFNYIDRDEGKTIYCMSLYGWTKSFYLNSTCKGNGMSVRCINNNN